MGRVSCDKNEERFDCARQRIRVPFITIVFGPSRAAKSNSTEIFSVTAARVRRKL